MLLTRALRCLQQRGGSSLTAAAATAQPCLASAGRRWAATEATGGSGTSGGNGGDAPGSGGADAAASSLESMLEVMMKDPGARDMLLSRLPERMRRPEVVRAMLRDPEVRARLGQLAQSAGLGGGGGGGGGGLGFGAAAAGAGAAAAASSSSPFPAAAPDAAALERGLAAARAAGIDPARVAAKLAASPALRGAAANPRIFGALLDICQNGPEAARRYEGDQEVLRAYFEAGAALQEAQAEARAGTAAPAAAAGDAPADAATAMPSLSDAEAGALRALVADPALAAKLASPRVRAALEEIARSPIRALKYAFDPEVRSALVAARRLVKDGAGAAAGGGGR